MLKFKLGCYTRPPETRGAISASLEGSDLPSSGSSRGLQQHAQSPPHSRVATYPRAEASSSAPNLRLARGWGSTLERLETSSADTCLSHINRCALIRC